MEEKLKPNYNKSDIEKYSIKNIEERISHLEEIFQKLTANVNQTNLPGKNQMEGGRMMERHDNIHYRLESLEAENAQLKAEIKKRDEEWEKWSKKALRFIAYYKNVWNRDVRIDAINIIESCPAMQNRRSDKEEG